MQKYIFGSIQIWVHTKANSMNAWVIFGRKQDSSSVNIRGDSAWELKWSDRRRLFKTTRFPYQIWKNSTSETVWNVFTGQVNVKLSIILMAMILRTFIELYLLNVVFNVTGSVSNQFNVPWKFGNTNIIHTGILSIRCWLTFADFFTIESHMRTYFALNHSKCSRCKNSHVYQP